MNKLWVCRSTAENIARAEKYEYFKANDKYCLVITDETPEKMAEVTEDAARSLTVHPICIQIHPLRLYNFRYRNSPAAGSRRSSA